LEEERGKKDVEKTAPMQKPKLIIQDSRRVKAARCLCCGSPNDAATGIATHHGDRDTPKPGDVMMCFYCGHLMEWAKDGGFTELSDAAAHAVAGDPVILALQKARAMAWKKRGS